MQVQLLSLQHSSSDVLFLCFLFSSSDSEDVKSGSARMRSRPFLIFVFFFIGFLAFLWFLRVRFGTWIGGWWQFERFRAQTCHWCWGARCIRIGGWWWQFERFRAQTCHWCWGSQCWAGSGGWCINIIDLTFWQNTIELNCDCGILKIGIIVRFGVSEHIGWMRIWLFRYCNRTACASFGLRLWWRITPVQLPVQPLLPCCRRRGSLPFLDCIFTHKLRVLHAYFKPLLPHLNAL